MQLAAAHSAAAVATPEALFAAGIDAVYIATFPDTHYAFARAALEAGLPVLCEKPVTRSLAELNELLVVAAVRNLLFMEAMKTPFFPLYRALSDHLVPSEGQGSLGPISFIQAGNATPNTPPDHPSWDASLAGGALMAIGVYQAFLAVDWLGRATETQAISQRFTRASNHPQVDTFTLAQSRHERGSSQIYAGLELASPGEAVLFAANGFATIHKPWWNPSRATITSVYEPPVELYYPVLGDGLHYETAHFCDLLRSGSRESPIVTHAHSRAVMHLLDRVRAAIHLYFPGESYPPA